MINEKEILQVEGLKRTYLVNETKIEVLKGINLTINSQEFIAIMGKSGSGKTTLLKLLGMLDRPTEGKVFFKGEDSNFIRGDRLAKIRRCELGFIYQDYYLMDSLSVRENIMLPKILDHSSVEESMEESEKLADIMGVRTLMDKRTFELSGGEKQRVAICRALINHSDLILADEPTGNLDSASSETVMEYLQMINKDMKKTVVLVTHDAYVASFCNRVIFVKDGMIEVELKKTEGQDEFCDQIMKEQKKILKR
ncbi:ABC transporter ATP-binding protein [Dorea longicatena]|uniref:ABC transporter ATP-binding protein n=1 Tax=Dorea longicatena TaxID=88431 RepID=UPI001D075925|nr:ABC transporter ATP-binding protein [Dorea longicatena]MCB6954059.1 ABC transporter ATP-binding protein [Dorea longicatena]MCG4677826.1 ABC transporter ATP-binding protein [Dorea longicatena]